MLDINKYLREQEWLKKTLELKRECDEKNRVRAIVERRKRRREVQSDEEEEEEGEERPPTVVSRTVDPGKQHRDDGDVRLYKARLKSCDASTTEYHELDEGLRVPRSVWTRLYRYQRTAVKWLWELDRIESGGLLGDEMGLGKTVQVIAFFSALSFSGRGMWGGLGPSIIIAPASVIHQWVCHFHDWWPPLRVAVLHQSGTYVGSADRLIHDMHSSHGILVMTYAAIVKHLPAIERRKWHYVVLDEGHKIRNPDTQISRAVRKIDTPHRIVMTGSPLQNNLQELWSLFDFMSPGLLGSQPAFVEHFAMPITQGGYSNATGYQESLAQSLAVVLKDTISPYLLRRTKADVQDHLSLPEKSEQVLFCSLSDEQKELYKNFLLSTTVRSILDKESRFGDPLRARILVALTTLRKICNHPDLYIYEVAEDSEDLSEHEIQSFGFYKRAGKMIVINSLLKIWKKQGHRVLIFTQSRAMICILEQFLQRNGHKYLKMDGSTNIGARQPLITAFNSDDSYLVFLATTRVGGLGVNLTGADRVIIYDPDWNPATDSQAKERAWRIGQRRDVTVYRLLSAGTVEEKIYQRQIFKQLLTNKVLLNPNQKNYLKTSTLQGLFSLEEPDKAGETETTNIFKHTKVVPTNKQEKDDSILLSGGVSFSSNKLAAMRRLAQKISQTMTDDGNGKNENQDVELDPRERYKMKLIPPPPEPEKEPVNTLDDQETSADFSAILSELDIVNLYSQPKKLNKLETFEMETEEGECVNEEGDDEDSKPQSVPDEPTCEDAPKERDKKKRKKRKRDEVKDSKNDIKFLKSVKTIKDKKKRDGSNSAESKNQDEYVLEKLFAKSGVQNALQHDKVIGLAEREDRLRQRTEAEFQATRALKALRKSRIKNWK